MATSIATLEGTRTTIDDEALEQLRMTIRGDVLVEGDTAYEEARAIFNIMHDRHPAIIVRCSGTADVADAVMFARQHDLLIGVRGGGHSMAGLSLCDGGIVIDLSRMRGVQVDPDARIARVQGGALWGDVDREAQPFGLVTPGGVVSETGVGGLTLGGGYGWVRRMFGLSCDNIISAQVVLADGSVRTASADNEPDLFWAIRGGGGNFGIVTAFEFRLHPHGPVVPFAGVFYAIEDAEKVLRGFREFALAAPDEVSCICVALTFPSSEHVPPPAHNRACIVVAAVVAGTGDPEKGMELLQGLRGLAEPVVDISQPMPFVMVQGAFDPLFPMGQFRGYVKSLYINELSDEAIATIAARAQDRPSDLASVGLWPMGGAIARVGATDTAFGDRSADFMVGADAFWVDAADDEANIGWVRSAYEAMAPFGNGTTYTNFTGHIDEARDTLADTAYAQNLARLREIKAKYDPENVFRINPNITPA